MSVTQISRPRPQPTTTLPGLPTGPQSFGLKLRQNSTSRSAVAREADVILETDAINGHVATITAFCNANNPTNPLAALTSVVVNLSDITDVAKRTQLINAWTIQLQFAGFTVAYLAPNLTVSF